MSLDTTTFESWMQRIMERFDRNEQMLCSLTRKDVKKVSYLDGELLYDNQDVCQLLNASKRTVQRYRSSGMLTYHMVKGKVYYKESDVNNFIRNHFEEFEQRSLRNQKNPKPKSAKRKPSGAT